MAVQRESDWLSIEDFLALDRESLDQKYEYMDGHMYALAGGSTNHSIISVNAIALISSHLGDGPCTTFNSDMTLKLQNACYLPDVMVSCDKKDLEESKTYIEFPRLVIEVLSPSTMRRDRYEKLLHYTKCPSIQEYALISQDIMLVEIYTRKDQEWIYHRYECDENVELKSIGLIFPIEKLYRRAIL
ncbi:MAG TPA: Uma2 family endonuclease [Ktedonobacteraceae bacterium]|jgi:Uma2 family endonuclease